jgi:hypothetical protein
MRNVEGKNILRYVVLTLTGNTITSDWVTLTDSEFDEARDELDNMLTDPDHPYQVILEKDRGLAYVPVRNIEMITMEYV